MLAADHDGSKKGSLYFDHIFLGHAKINTEIRLGHFYPVWGHWQIQFKSRIGQGIQGPSRMNTPNQASTQALPLPLLYSFHCTQCIMVYLLVLVKIKGYGVWVTRSKVKIIIIAPSLCYCTLRKFHISDQITSEGRNVCDQIAFCACHSFWAEIQTNAGYIHVTRVIIIWRLESSRLLFSPTIIIFFFFHSSWQNHLGVCEKVGEICK